MLFLLVAYHNWSDVVEFVEHVRDIGLGDDCAFAICDNSETVGAPRSPLHNCVVTQRPDNPGYLEGALAALGAYGDSGRVIPDWVALSNTDLQIRTHNLVDVLDAAFDPAEPAVIAPRITEGAELLNKNPHLLHPRSQWRLRLNRYATATPSLAFGYLRLNVWRTRRDQRRISPGVLSTNHTNGEHMYAPYGALMIFSRAFLEQVDIPTDVPLLAEEHVIAELARRAGIPVIYEAGIHVHHYPNSTTGPRISRRRAAMLSRAFLYIDHYDGTHG